MSDDTPIKVPVGDASHLLDSEPKTKADVSTIATPLGIGEPDGSATTPRDADTGSLVTIPTQVVDIKGAQEQIEEVKAGIEPCGSCMHFKWPQPGSDDWHAREAAIMGPKRRLPAQFAHIWPFGGPPEEFGGCSEPDVVVTDGARVGRMSGKALVHYLRPGCKNYRQKPGGISAPPKAG